MNRIFSILIAIVIAVPVMFSQDDDLQTSVATLQSQVEGLSAKISSHEATISSLQSQLAEVLSQNLSLKKNLRLQPTIAKAKARDIMEYRVLEVTGDPSTHEVHLVISAENISGVTKEIFYNGTAIVDELGNGYNNYDRYYYSIKGVCEKFGVYTIKHFANAPYTLDLYIQGFNPEANYIKLLSLDAQCFGHNPIAFENLKINWVAD